MIHFNENSVSSSREPRNWEYDECIIKTFMEMWEVKEWSHPDSMFPPLTRNFVILCWDQRVRVREVNTSLMNHFPHLIGFLDAAAHEKCQLKVLIESATMNRSIRPKELVPVPLALSTNLFCFFSFSKAKQAAIKFPWQRRAWMEKCLRNHKT